MIESLSFYLLLSVAFLTVMKITLRIKLALNALMHSHVVLKKQIVLLVESVDKLLHSAKKKGMHLIHFEKSASENDNHC